MGRPIQRRVDCKNVTVAHIRISLNIELNTEHWSLYTVGKSQASVDCSNVSVTHIRISRRSVNCIVAKLPCPSATYFIPSSWNDPPRAIAPRAQVAKFLAKEVTEVSCQGGFELEFLAGLDTTHKVSCREATCQVGRISAKEFLARLDPKWKYEFLGRKNIIQRGVCQYENTRSLGALRAPTSRLRPFGPAW